MHKLLVIDTETGGLDPSKHSIMSLGAVVWEDGKLVDTFEVFILEPDLVYDETAIDLNRIDIRWLRTTGLRPDEAVKGFHSFLEKNFDDLRRGERISVAGHNVGFDIGFLKRLYRLAGYDYDEFFSHRVFDTASIIRFLILAEKVSLSNASSDEAFRYFGITFEPKGRHTALGDATATALLLNKLINLVKR